MADVFGYYDTNRGLLGDALAMDPKYKVNDPTTDAPVTNSGWTGQYSALTPSSIINSATGGMIGGGISNPNEPNGGWYATNLDTGGSIHPVTGDQYRTLTDSSHSNRDLLQAAAKVAALIYGGAALSGVGAGGAASGISNAGLGFGGSAGSALAGTPFQAAGEYGAVPGGSVAAGSIPAGAAEASGEFGGSLVGAGAELGATPFQASGEAGAVPGSSAGSIPAGATQASGEYGAGPSWLAKLNQFSKMGGGSPQGQAQSPQFSAPLMPQRSGGGFLQQLVKPRPNYLGRFGDAVMASQSANDLLLKSKLFSRERL